MPNPTFGAESEVRSRPKEKIQSMPIQCDGYPLTDDPLNCPSGIRTTKPLLGAVAGVGSAERSCSQLSASSSITVRGQGPGGLTGRAPTDDGRRSLCGVARVKRCLGGRQSARTANAVLWCGSAEGQRIAEVRWCQDLCCRSCSLAAPSESSTVAVRGIVSLTENPGMSLIHDFGYERQIVTPETGRVLPIVTVLVKTADGHVVTSTVLSGILPDRSLYAAHSDFVDWTRRFRFRSHEFNLQR